MKYYSEELNRLFDTEDELLEAEFSAQAAAEAKAAQEAVEAEEKERRYIEVKEALDAVASARAHYNKLLREYTKDYGAITLRTPQVTHFWF